MVIPLEISMVSCLGQPRVQAILCLGDLTARRSGDEEVDVRTGREKTKGAGRPYKIRRKKIIDLEKNQTNHYRYQ